MAKQTPTGPLRDFAGFPYSDCWEEFGCLREALRLHGTDRDVIDRYFKRAHELQAPRLTFEKKEFEEMIAPLGLSAEREEQLADKLYYLAGHYLAPAFRKFFEESPSDVRVRLERIASTAAEVDVLMGDLGFAGTRFLRGARMRLGKERQGDLDVSLTELQAQLANLSKAAELVAAKIPRFKRGSTVQVLRARWLRESVAVIEGATQSRIVAKVSDTDGKNYRLEGPEGEVFERYCGRVANISVKPMVEAVRAYHASLENRPPS